MWIYNLNNISKKQQDNYTEDISDRQFMDGLPLYLHSG